MKNKSFKILSISLLFIAFGIILHFNSVDAYCELKNGTLTIHNELSGKLSQEYKKSDDDYNYYKLSFDGLSYKKVIEASLKVDGTKKNYKVNGTKVTEEEFDEFEGTIGGYVLFSKAN